MHYTGEVYRPPLEANTPLLEVTYGCSHNKCAFCIMYHQTPFGIAPLEEVEEDIVEISQYYPRPIERIYLLNGDPFVLSTGKLMEIANLIKKHIPEIKTITSYASFYNLKNKTKEQLKQLREAGYNELWFGVETGYNKVLARLNKNADLNDYYNGLDKMKYAGIEYHAIIMQGIAGRGNSIENAKATAKLLNYYPPKGVYPMSTDVQRGSELYEMRERGDFIETTNRENLTEQLELLKNLNLPDNVFYSSAHMVNLVNISGHLKNKEKLIEKIQKALDNMDDSILDMTNFKIAR